MPVSEGSSSSSGGGASAILPYVAGAIQTAATAITKGGPKRQYKYNKKLADQQQKYSRQNARWALMQNRKLLAEERAYNTASSQMERYRAAGLNPNLIYGNVAQSSDSVRVGAPPTPNMGAVDASYPDIAGTFMDSMLAQSQMGLTQAKTDESIIKQEVLSTQNQVLQANPYLRPKYVDSIVQQMEATAALKAQEADFMLSKTRPGTTASDGDEVRWQRGYLVMQRQLDLLGQKYDLGKADQKIKAEIIEGKGFQNDLSEIQRNWLQDAEITPEHIRQGIMMLLGKFR